MKDRKKIWIGGFALFSMFFGAGNLLFPPVLGRDMGTGYLVSALGFSATAVGLVMLGVIATIKVGGSIENLGGSLGQGFSKFFGTMVLLAIGPGLAIPRNAATTYEVIQGTIFKGLSPVIASIIFFALVLFFTIKPQKVVSNIGKILTPSLLILLAIIIFRAVTSPMGTPVDKNVVGIFGKSFEEGYQTMDALAALVFTKVIIDGFRYLGIEEEKEILSFTKYSAVISGIGLAIIYFGLEYMGSTLSGLGFDDMGRVELLIYSTDTILGKIGGIILSLAMALACLTTAIGLTATVGDFFSGLFKNKNLYVTIVIISSAISTFFAISGVDKIVVFSVPVLVSLYPVAITLIVLNVLGGEFIKRPIMLGSVLGSFIPSIKVITELLGYPVDLLAPIANVLPDGFTSFVWIIPVIILGAVFHIFKIGSKSK